MSVNIFSVSGPQYSLQVWWRGDDDNEYFTLRCRSEEQLNKWESAINSLIERTQARRGSEPQRNAPAQANSTNPSQLRQLDMARKLSSTSNQSVMSPISGPSSATRRYPPTAFEYDDFRSRESSVSNSVYFAAPTAGPSGYPQDVDNGYEDYDDFQYNSHYGSSSGRGTPMGSRRGNVAQSMVQEREMNGAYDRPRARTEDQDGATLRQWRKNGQPMPPPPPPPVGALPNPLLHGGRPAPNRMTSDASDMSFGPGIAPRPQPTLRSKFSSNRLNSHYDSNESDRTVTTLNRAPSRPPMRSRSASQPSAYNPLPPSQPPPLPKSNWAEISKGAVVDSSASNKRGSGSSESTGESSDYSPHSASPITPYGSSDSSLPGTTLRTSRSQVYLQKSSAMAAQGMGVQLVKVKVYFLDDIFAIQVPRTIEYEELVEKVGKKIRLCGSRRDDGPLKVKYMDEDGDMVSLGSTEDVQMAFETMQSNNQVTLHVS